MEGKLCQIFCCCCSVTKSCPTLCNLVDCSKLGSCVPHYLLEKPRRRIKKSRHAKVFLVMYGCEGRTIKKAEHQRIDAFELWCWRRLSRVPWTAWKSNQLILKEISPEYSLEGLMLKPKLRYFGHLMGRTDSLEKILMLGKIEGKRRRG